MATDITTAKSWNSYSDTIENKSSINNKAGQDTHEAASLDIDSQQMLLKAQRNAEEAKEAALGAISRFYEQSQVSEKRAEKMVRELDDAIQHAITATQKSKVKNQGTSKNSTDDDLSEFSLHGKDKKLKLSKKVLNNGPLGNLFSNNTKELDPEVNVKFNVPGCKPSLNLDLAIVIA